MSTPREQVRCPSCGEKMAVGQIFCFACGARPSEHAPHPGFRVSLGGFLGLTAAWLLLMAIALAPIVSGRSWQAMLGGRSSGTASDNSGRAGQAEVAAGRLVADYQRKVSAMLREVAHLRRYGNRAIPAESLAATLAWAEAQLEATRRIALVFSAISDSEAVTDVEQFLDERLARVQLRLDELRR